MTHTHDRGEELTREDRRAQIATAIRRGITDQRTLAKQFGVSQPTISRDIAAIEVQLKQQTLRDLSAAKALSLARLDRALTAVWDKVIAGDLWAIRTMVRLEERRAKLLGLDEPARAVVSGDEDAPIYVDVEHRHELSDRARRFAEQLAEINGTSVEAAIAEAERLLAEVP
jgi:hypothetical protein